MDQKNKITIKQSGTPQKTPEIHSEVMEKSVWRRLKDSFFVASPKEIANAIVDNVIIPGIANSIANSLYTFVDVAIYHRQPTIRNGNYIPGRGGGGGPLNYGAAAQAARNQKSVKTAAGYIFRNLTFDTMDDCDIVWDRIVDIYNQYGVVTVYQFYDAAGRTADYTDNYYGWTNLDGCGYGIEDGRYYIEMPEPIKISK